MMERNPREECFLTLLIRWGYTLEHYVVALPNMVITIFGNAGFWQKKKAGQIVQPWSL